MRFYPAFLVVAAIGVVIFVGTPVSFEGELRHLTEKSVQDDSAQVQGFLDVHVLEPDMNTSTGCPVSDPKFGKALPAVKVEKTRLNYAFIARKVKDATYQFSFVSKDGSEKIVRSVTGISKQDIKAVSGSVVRYQVCPKACPEECGPLSKPKRVK